MKQGSKQALKKRMTFDEMSRHMQENSFKLPNRVTVGMYAKEIGYTTYKAMIAGKINFFYVNNDIENID